MFAASSATSPTTAAQSRRPNLRATTRPTRRAATAHRGFHRINQHWSVPSNISHCPTTANFEDFGTAWFTRPTIKKKTKEEPLAVPAPPQRARHWWAGDARGATANQITYSDPVRFVRNHTAAFVAHASRARHELLGKPGAAAVIGIRVLPQGVFLSGRAPGPSTLPVYPIEDRRGSGRPGARLSLHGLRPSIATTTALRAQGAERSLDRRSWYSRATRATFARASCMT